MRCAGTVAYDKLTEQSLPNVTLPSSFNFVGEDGRGLNANMLNTYVFCVFKDHHQYLVQYFFGMFHER